MRSRVSLLSGAVLKLAGLNTTVPREGSSGLTPVWRRPALDELRQDMEELLDGLVV
jgi:hypothetical protein